MGMSPQEMQLMLRLGRAGAGKGELGDTLGEVGSGLGAYEGFQSGTPMGDISGAANLANLGVQSGALKGLGFDPSSVSDIGKGATGALDALAMYQGIKQGGWQGYGQALGAGLQGAGTLLGDAALSTAGGYVLAPLAVYNAVKNWQSGATGSDALQGAEAGAAIGSIVPGIGTLIGAGIGAGVGALSSAFGGGRPDLETGGWNQFAKAYNQATPQQQAAVMPNLDPAQAYQNLAGVMDAKNNTPGHSQSIEQVFGRMGEQNMMDQMTNYINQQVASGAIKPGESVGQQWTQTINPWLQSKGVTWDPNQKTSTGQLETPALQGDIQSLIGSWESGRLTPQSQVGGQGQTIGGMQNWLGSMPAPTGNTQVATPAQPSMMYNPTLTPGQPAMAQAESYGLHAEGGLMKRSKKRQALLDQIRRAPPIYRRHFQDGGDTSDDGGDLYEAGQILGDTGTSAQDPNVFTSGGAWGNYGDPAAMKAAADAAAASDSSSSSTGSKIMKDLEAAGKTLTGGSGLGPMLKGIASLAPLASLFIRPKTNLNPPGPVPGMTQGAKNPNAPMYSRTQVGAPGGLSSSQLTQGTGVTPQIGSPGSPSNLPGGKPMSLGDWYTYGQRPEAQFFQNNFVPLAQATGVAQGQASGGALRHIHHEPDTDESVMLPEFDSAFEHHAEGPGDGTSDNIPAQLSDGEYVMDANTVSLLGNGSNKAGAARLDQLRENIRKHAAGSMSKGKQFMKAKPPQAYMAMGKRRR